MKNTNTKKLTAKQEKFAQGVASGLDQSAAYRAAFTVRPGSKAQTAWDSASRLAADPRVAARIEALRAPAIKEVKISLLAHITELQSLRDAAKKNNSFSPAVQAEMAIGKVSGLYVDKLELGNKDDKPLKIDLSVLSDAELSQFIALREKIENAKK